MSSSEEFTHEFDNMHFSKLIELASPQLYDDFVYMLFAYGWRKLGGELGYNVPSLDRFEREGEKGVKRMINEWAAKEHTYSEMDIALCTIDHYTARRKLNECAISMKIRAIQFPK